MRSPPLPKQSQQHVSLLKPSRQGIRLPGYKHSQIHRSSLSYFICMQRCFERLQTSFVQRSGSWWGNTKLNASADGSDGWLCHCWGPSREEPVPSGDGRSQAGALQALQWVAEIWWCRGPWAQPHKSLKLSIGLRYPQIQGEESCAWLISTVYAWTCMYKWSWSFLINPAALQYI